VCALEAIYRIAQTVTIAEKLGCREQLQARLTGKQFGSLLIADDSFLHLKSKASNPTFL
jgi:hypothetical protein